MKIKKKSQNEGQVSKWERNISVLFIVDAVFPTNILSTICKLSVFTDILDRSSAYACKMYVFGKCACTHCQMYYLRYSKGALRG